MTGMGKTMIKRLWQMAIWVEWIEPSTSRNGLKGAVMNVAFLFAFVSIGPTFIPGLCQQREARPEPKPWRELTTVFFGKGKGPKVCACHIDFKRYGATDIEHHPYQGMPTCESEPSAHDVWIKPEPPAWELAEKEKGTAITSFAVVIWNGPEGKEYRLKEGEGEYRWHCTEDSEYLK